MNAPIGVFDSGVGGLTVAREIMRQLPEESMIYFGDTARVPYGTKSKDTIVRYSRQIVNFLLSKGVKAVVIACNTASALALADLQELYNVPIIGMVQPGAIAAMNATKNKNIGIIGTKCNDQEWTVWPIFKETRSICNCRYKSMSIICSASRRRTDR